MINLKRSILTFVVLLAWCPWANAISEKLYIDGEVKTGQTFEQPIGGDLFFRLVPDNSGWEIFIGRGRWGFDNFCSVVTPPYRGTNHIYIEGWHFRNADNSGPNAAGEKNVNAPGELREFYFVVNEDDYQWAFDSLEKILWSTGRAEEEVQAARERHDRLRKGKGFLKIEGLQLSNLETGKQAQIDSFKFHVELDLPEE